MAAIKVAEPEARATAARVAEEMKANVFSCILDVDPA